MGISPYSAVKGFPNILEKKMYSYDVGYKVFLLIFDALGIALSVSAGLGAPFCLSWKSKDLLPLDRSAYYSRLIILCCPR